MLYNKLNIRFFLKAKRWNWAGYFWRVGENFTRDVLIKNPTKKQSRERPHEWWWGSVKKDISDTDGSKRLDEAMKKLVSMQKTLMAWIAK